MSKHFQQTHLFTLRPGAADVPHEELAHEAMELAKGGHTVALTLPDGAVSVAPEDAHHEIVAKISDAMPAGKRPTGKSHVKGKSDAE